MTRLLVSDFDGTLSKRYMSMDFMEYLNAIGLYSPESYEKQNVLLELKKEDKITYEEWCSNWGEEWGRGLMGQSVEKIHDEAINFFHDFKHNIHDISYDFVHRFKEKEYVTMLLSVGAYEVVSLAGIHLDFDKFYGTQAKSENGIYTGELETRIHEPLGKEMIVRNIIGSNYDTKKSVGVGDSFSDLGFMKILGNQVALNADEKLSYYANKHGWKYNLRFEEMNYEEMAIWVDDIIRGDVNGIDKIK